MGGVGDALFGKPSEQSSDSTSHSGNLAYPAISGAFSPALGYTTQGGGMMANLLGLGGGPAQTAGLQNFADSGGMKFMQDQGNRQINSNQAAKGLLNSGSTLKALEKYGQGLGSTYLNQYMSQLMDLSKLGLGAGGIMAQAGQTSDSKSHSEGTGEKQGMLGQIAAGAAQGAAMGA